MSESEFFRSGCFNHHSKFTFSNGQEITGVISNFRGPKDMNYYLVTTPNLRRYKDYEEANDEANMIKLASLIDLSSLIKAGRIQTRQTAF